MTFNEKLKQALAENHNERISRSAACEKPHKFSLAYKLWERKMLRDIRRNLPDNRWTLHKARHVVTAIAIAAAIVLSLTGCAVVSLVTSRFSFNYSRYHSRLFVENISSDKTRIEEYYGLPEEDGWIIGDFYADNFIVKISYTRGDESVKYIQQVIHGDMGVVNAENPLIEPMSIYEENDGFFIDFQTGRCGLWWIYDGYFFIALGNLNKNEMIDLARSTKIQEF